MPNIWRRCFNGIHCLLECPFAPFTPHPYNFAAIHMSSGQAQIKRMYKSQPTCSLRIAHVTNAMTLHHPRHFWAMICLSICIIDSSCKHCVTLQQQ